VCRSAAFGKSGLAEGSSPSEFADATADHRQIEVIGIEGTAVPLGETLVLGMARLRHGIGNSSKPHRQPLARATLQSDPGRKTDQSASATREPGSVLLLSYTVDFDRHLEIENVAVIRAIAD
jgi:hypothetical protein